MTAHLVDDVQKKNCWDEKASLADVDQLSPSMHYKISSITCSLLLLLLLFNRSM